MIDTCVNCDYSLKGLPANHRCPECGLAYDERSEVYRVINPWVVFAGLGGFLAGLGGIIHLATGLERMGGWMRMISIGSIIVYCVALAFGMHTAWNLKRRGQLVAVLPDSLMIRLQRLTPQRIPWADLSRATVAPGFLGATLFLKHRKTARDIRGVFKTRADAARFVDQVNERIARANEAEALAAPDAM